MQFRENDIKGVFEIRLEPRDDERGFFMRTYDDKIFKSRGLATNWVQESHSYSREKNTLRGLHFQIAPFEETKLIRVLGGEAFIIFVDLRKDSPSFGKWNSVVLSNENKKMLYIPRGFAMGMCTLTQNCTLAYKMDNYYSPNHAETIKWNDADIAIRWPTDNPVISEKDSKAEGFKYFVKKYNGLEE